MTDEGKETGPTDPSSAIDKETVRLLSHRLRAPIDAVAALLKTITEGFVGEVNPEALRLAQRAVVRAEEASAIVSDLIDHQRYGRADRLSVLEGGCRCREHGQPPAPEGLTRRAT